jgi:hypothetical protein
MYLVKNLVYPRLGQATVTLVKAAQDPILRKKTVEQTQQYLKLPLPLRCFSECLDATTIQALRDELNRYKPWAGEFFYSTVYSVKTSLRKEVLPHLNLQELRRMPLPPSKGMDIRDSTIGFLLKKPLPTPVPPRSKVVEVTLNAGRKTYDVLPEGVKDNLRRFEMSEINRVLKILDRKYTGLGDAFQTFFFFAKDKLNSPER